MYNLKHFKIQELVSPEIFNQRGNKAVELIDPRLLETMDTLREELGRPITANNWIYGGVFTQRGLRDRSFYKTDKAYQDSLSQHKFGRACDFDVKGLSAKQVNQFIIDNKDKFPYISFIEVDCNWTHIDVRNGVFRLWSPSRGFVNSL